MQRPSPDPLAVALVLGAAALAVGAVAAGEAAALLRLGARCFATTPAETAGEQAAALWRQGLLTVLRGLSTLLWATLIGVLLAAVLRSRLRLIPGAAGQRALGLAAALGATVLLGVVGLGVWRQLLAPATVVLPARLGGALAWVLGGCALMSGLRAVLSYARRPAAP